MRKKNCELFWLYGFTNRSDFLSSLLLLLHNEQRLFYLVQKILGYVHAQNCIILKTILSTSLMWKKDLKLHHNLSLTITDKTSYDILTLGSICWQAFGLLWSSDAHHNMIFAITKVYVTTFTMYLSTFCAWRTVFESARWTDTLEYISMGGTQNWIVL